MGHIDPKTRQDKTNGPNGVKRNTEQATSLNRQKNIKFKRGMNFKQCYTKTRGGLGSCHQDAAFREKKLLDTKPLLLKRPLVRQHRLREYSESETRCREKHRKSVTGEKSQKHKAYKN